MKVISIISMIILAISIYKYCNTSNVLDFYINVNIKRLENLRNLNDNMEAIWSIKRSAPFEFRTPDNFFNDKKTDYNKIQLGDDEVLKYSLDLEYLSHKAQILTSHSATVLPNWMIVQDAISKELLVGKGGGSIKYDEAQELFLNDKKIRLDDYGMYNLLLEDRMNFIFKKYSYDRCNTKIDTFSILRTIETK